jgi:structural maintenance of chromosome 1
MTSLQGELEKARQELANQQSERQRIMCVNSFTHDRLHLAFTCRQLEKEANEKLGEIHHKLIQAGSDRSESEKEAKFKETLSNLQRIFPGW